MMKRNLYSILIFSLALLLSACASKPSQFYVLNPISSGTQVKKQVNYQVGIERIELAKYLDQPQIVTRKTNHELHLDEFNRWAEPLKDNIQQVLQSNLQHLLRHAMVASYPWSATFNPKYTITVKILKFDTNSHGQSLLQADIEIRDQAGKMIKVLTNKHYFTKVNPKNYNAIVTGMNANLSKLSRTLASLVS